MSTPSQGGEDPILIFSFSLKSNGIEEGYFKVTLNPNDDNVGNELPPQWKVQPNDEDMGNATLGVGYALTLKRGGSIAVQFEYVYNGNDLKSSNNDSKLTISLIMLKNAHFITSKLSSSTSSTNATNNSLSPTLSSTATPFPTLSPSSPVSNIDKSIHNDTTIMNAPTTSNVTQPSPGTSKIEQEKTAEIKENTNESNQSMHDMHGMHGGSSSSSSKPKVTTLGITVLSSLSILSILGLIYVSRSSRYSYSSLFSSLRRGGTRMSDIDERLDAGDIDDFHRFHSLDLEDISHDGEQLNESNFRFLDDDDDDDDENDNAFNGNGLEEGVSESERGRWVE